MSVLVGVIRSGSALGLAAVVLSGGCDGSPAPPLGTPVAVPGAPLPALTPEEARRFEEGRVLFARRYGPDEGVGPFFNEDACNACHTDPADGGTGEQLLVRASRFTAPDRCDALAGGDNVRLRTTPGASAMGLTPEPVPPGASHSGRFTVPFLFGLGLVEAVPLESLEALADPDDADGDGISGRIGLDAAGRPARFGRKSDVAELRDFVETAAHQEMGLTTPGHPVDRMSGGPAPEGADTVPDPELPEEALERLTDFVRFLAPPAPRVPDDPEEAARVAEGARLFRSLGCVGCHVPALETGAAASPALERKRIVLFSDLLLHDMGPELAGPCAPGAGPTEYRTAPLMGLRHRPVFLHDGRARRIGDAILLHGGEARSARHAFEALGRVAQEAVVAFLETL